jgi:signal transduction histidine kinase
MAVNKKKRGKHREVSGLGMKFMDVDQQKAPNKLARVNQQLEDLARFPRENPNPVIIVDRDGSILFANPACSRLDFFKCQPGQLLPDRYKQIIAEVLDTGSHRVIEAEGKERIFTLDFVPVTDAGYVNIYGLDITERKKAEKRIEELLRERSEQLQQSQTNFELLVHTMAEGVIVVDTSGHIQFTNPAAAAIFNLPEKELIGYYFGVPAAVGVTEVEALVEQQRKALELNAVKIVWGGKPGYLATLRDITQQKRVAERIRMLSHRLVEAQERERRDIGHELHDEVGGALTAVKLALGRAQKKLGKKSESELEKVNALLDETMDLVSSLSYKMRPDILNEFGLVEALKWHFERYASQTGVKVRFKRARLAERYPEIIETTAYRIIQESLTNVARYAKVNQVTVSIHSDSEKLYIQVEDRGCGFDPQQIETESSGISGMQDRAFLAGGELVVDSSPGKGTSVTCELPLDNN